MKILFDKVPGNARIWIFQSSRLLTSSEEMQLEKAAFDFLESWTAHKVGLTASATLRDHLFLVIAVDETEVGASGCSLDKLHQFVKSLELSLGIKLLDRLNIAFVNSEGELAIEPLHRFEEMLKAGSVDGETRVYDLTVADVAAYKSHFLGPLKNTWLQRYQLV